MSQDTKADGDKVITQADLDAARSDGVAEGIKTENTRVTGILAHEKAGPNFAQAANAISTGLTLEQATGVLDSMPEAVKADASANAFVAAMNAQKNPDVDADVGSDADESDDAIAASIVSLVKPVKHAGGR